MKKMMPFRAVIKHLRNNSLPDGLRQKVIQQYLTAAGIALAMILFSVYDQKVSYLLGLVIPAALVYLGVHITLSFERGKIEELLVQCTSVSTYAMRNTTQAVFRTEEEEPKYHSFILPGKAPGKKLIPNMPYVIYVFKTRPDTLLSFKRIDGARS